MARFLNLLNALMLAILIFSCGEDKKQEVTVGEATGELAADSLDPKTGLVIDEGMEVVKANCLGCHSSKLIIQNRANKEGWESIIDWMQKTQNLWELGTNESIIVNYLARNYAPEEKGRRENLKNIEWYELEQ